MLYFNKYYSAFIPYTAVNPSCHNCYPPNTCVQGVCLPTLGKK